MRYTKAIAKDITEILTDDDAENLWQHYAYRVDNDDKFTATTYDEAGEVKDTYDITITVTKR